MKTASVGLLVLVLLAPAARADKKVDEAISKAEEQIRKGKPDEARKIVDRLRQQQPDSPEAHLGAGRVLERIGGAESLEEASTSVARALELSPPGSPFRADALAAASAVGLARGASRDALSRAQEAVELQPNAAHFALLSRARARTHDLKGALEAAERGVQADGASAAAATAKGGALLSLGRHDEAVAAFRRGLELDPQANSARIGLALSLTRQGKGAEAAAEARKATAADAKSAEAFAVLGLALLAENPKNWNEAIAEAQQGAFLSPRNPAVQYAVGQIFEAAENLDQAAAAYDRAVKIDPVFVPARLALVRIAVRRGQLDAALAETRKIVADAPQNGDAQLRLGEILLRKEDYDGALAPLQKAVEALPGSAEGHYYLGRAYHFTGKLKDAAQEYKRAVELDPKNQDYRITSGLMQGVIGEYEAGIADLRKVIETPGYKGAAAYINLGWIYRSMEPRKPADSIAAYTKALELDPKNAQAALGLGWAHSFAKNWEPAIAAFRKAAEVDPRLAGETDFGIASAYFFKKEMAQARAYADKAQAAGRNVAGLKQRIQDFEKRLAEGQAPKTPEDMGEVDTGPDIGKLSRDLYSSNPDVRRRAVREMRELGAEAVPYLIYAAANDEDWKVRDTACQSLGAIGPAARAAVKTLRQIVEAERVADPFADREKREQETLAEDVRRTCQDALRKIQGR